MRSDRGSATVQAAAVVALLSLVAFTCLQVALAVSLRQQAAAAADLSALAASRASVEGEEPCGVARSVAAGNGARLRACRMDADVATVTARAVGPRWWIGRWMSDQRARAAPAWYLE
ncbi:Rv3654c family TadE-like protein [Aeromicrobium choanae]|uniref:Rv3654c family TadE-like protein n=1 Tax=Aeromicrobium choanae TaxID=1736691 RepID=UPI00099B0099|nr:Rv3654c family TadE-like protein [Aeromicrobium choanae]